jgi:hypothetical protein
MKTLTFRGLLTGYSEALVMPLGWRSGVRRLLVHFRGQSSAR